MRRNRKSIAGVVKDAYLRILPIQILGIVVNAVNVFVDGVITGQFLGTTAMAAIGLFFPVSIAIGIVYVINVGMQVLCCQYIGSGEKKKIITTFSTAVSFLILFSFILTTGILMFSGELSELLGANEDTKTLLVDYMRGYAPGILGQVVSGTLMFMLPYNNDTKRSYIGICLMITVNLLLDIIVVVCFGMGTFGMGLATALSYLISTAAMFTGFIRREKTIHFNLKSVDLKILAPVIRLGMPNMMFTIGNTFKSYMLNMALLTAAGAPGVAALNVQGTLCSVLGAIPLGIAESYLSLASVYYGEKDKNSWRDVMRFALRIGFLISFIVMILLMSSFSLLPSLFFEKTDTAWEIARQMLLIFPSYLVGETIYNLLLKSYQCQSRMVLVNVMTLVFQLITVALAYIGLHLFGLNGVWLAFPTVEIVAIVIIGISVFLEAGQVTFKLEDWMKLPKNFGAKDSDCLEMSLFGMEDVINISENVMSFCKGKGVSRRNSMIAGLAVEEMAGNVVNYGFADGKEHSVDIRLVADDNLTLRIRDNCPEFDPSKRVDQFTPEDPAKNVGIRMIAKLAEEMVYSNNAGINNVLIKIKTGVKE